MTAADHEAAILTAEQVEAALEMETQSDVYDSHAALVGLLQQAERKVSVLDLTVYEFRARAERAEQERDEALAATTAPPGGRSLGEGAVRAITKYGEVLERLAEEKT